MSALLSKFDLITAERISGYLKQRIYELEAEVPHDQTIERMANPRPDNLSDLVYDLDRFAIIRELRELKIHIDGDLNSMLNDMEAGSYR